MGTQHHQCTARFKISLRRPDAPGNQKTLSVGFADHAVVFPFAAQIHLYPSGQGDQNLFSESMGMPAALRTRRYVGNDESTHRIERQTGEIDNAQCASGVDKVLQTNPFEHVAPPLYSEL